jgi:mRNA interferase MazF
MFKRGTVLTVALGGGSGHKPRPAIAVQASDLDFPETLVVVPFTSENGSTPNLRPVFLPDRSNGLIEPSSLMTHRIMSVRKSAVGKAIGTMSPEDMARVDAALSLVLGFNAG